MLQLLDNNATHDQTVSLSEWRQQGENLVRRGAESFDQCLELVCHHISDPRFRAEVLAEWGMADAQQQLEAWYFFRSELAEGDPLHALNNTQRMALFGHGELFTDQLIEAARELVQSRGPRYVTTAWARMKVALLREQHRSLRESANLRTGRVTATVQVTQLQQQMQELEAENKRLVQENAELIQLVDALNNSTTEVAA